MSGQKFISTCCYVDADKVELLRQLSEKTRVPAAEYIRQGVELVLANQSKPPEHPVDPNVVDLSGYTLTPEILDDGYAEVQLGAAEASDPMLREALEALRQIVQLWEDQGGSRTMMEVAKAALVRIQAMAKWT